jgi:MFS family permease
VTPFRSPPFRRLWCSSVASAGAMGMERTATAWLALETGGGGLAVGLTLAARMLPSLLFGLAAGTIADRSDRRRQLIAVAAAALPLMLLLGWLVGAGFVRAWHVVAISFAAGCLQAFDVPARQALILDTVPRSAAASAVALNAVGTRLTTAAGAFSAGLLIPLGGVPSCYALVAGLFALGAVLVARLPTPPPVRADLVRPSFRRALRDAARLVVDVPALRTLFVAGIVCEVFAFSHQTALPVLARDVLAAGPEGLGTLNGAAQVGGTLAVALLTIVPAGVRREPLLGAVFLLYGAAILALSSTGDLALAAAMMVVTGACAGAFDTLQQTLIQLSVPEEQRGRAVGVWVLGLGSAPLGHVEMGLAVASIGAPGALAINGALVVVSAAALMARARDYRWRVGMGERAG